MRLCVFASAGTQVPPQPWLESVSTDLHALSRGFIPAGRVVVSGMENRPTLRYSYIINKKGG